MPSALGQQKLNLASADQPIAIGLRIGIAAVGQSFRPIGSTGMEFSLLVPESTFRQGRNDVRLYEVARK